MQKKQNAIEKMAVIKGTYERISVYKLKSGRWADGTPFKIGQETPFANRSFDSSELEFDD